MQLITCAEKKLYQVAAERAAAKAKVRQCDGLNGVKEDKKPQGSENGIKKEL